MTDRALEGLRVVELGAGIPAAYATKLLADLGADVIKVEPPGGDPLRLHGPFPNDEPDPETGTLHLFLNANKRDVTADLEADEGRSRLLDLACHADLVVHNLAPSDLERLRIEHPDLEAMRPGLVMVSITPFGYDTPHRDWARQLARDAGGVGAGPPHRRPGPRTARAAVRRR